MIHREWKHYNYRVVSMSVALVLALQPHVAGLIRASMHADVSKMRTHLSSMMSHDHVTGGGGWRSFGANLIRVVGHMAMMVGAAFASRAPSLKLGTVDVIAALLINLVVQKAANMADVKEMVQTFVQNAAAVEMAQETKAKHSSSPMSANDDESIGDDVVKSTGGVGESKGSDVVESTATDSITATAKHIIDSLGSIQSLTERVDVVKNILMSLLAQQETQAFKRLAELEATIRSMEQIADKQLSYASNSRHL